MGPLPGVSNHLGGADTLPFPSSPGGITAADLVKPRAKRPPAAAGRLRPGAGALLAVLPPATPRPRLGLLGVESPSDPACAGLLPAAMGRRLAGSRLPRMGRNHANAAGQRARELPIAAGGCGHTGHPGATGAPMGWGSYVMRPGMWRLPQAERASAAGGMHGWLQRPSEPGDQDVPSA